MAENAKNPNEPVQKTPATDADRKAQDKLQEQLVNRIGAGGGGASRTQAATTDTLLTTEEHLGKRAAEPHKPKEQEALKVGSHIAVGPRVDTVEISSHESGKATDTLVVNSGAGAAPAGAANTHLHDAVGIGQVRSEVAKENGGEENGSGNGQPVVRTHQVVGSVRQGETGSEVQATPQAEGLTQREGESDEDFARRKSEAAGGKVE